MSIHRCFGSWSACRVSQDGTRAWVRFASSWTEITQLLQLAKNEQIVLASCGRHTAGFSTNRPRHGIVCAGALDMGAKWISDAADVHEWVFRDAGILLVMDGGLEWIPADGLAAHTIDVQANTVTYANASTTVAFAVDNKTKTVQAVSENKVPTKLVSGDAFARRVQADLFQYTGLPVTEVRFGNHVFRDTSLTMELKEASSAASCVHVMCTFSSRVTDTKKGLVHLESEIARQLTWAHHAQIQRAQREVFYPPRDTVDASSNQLICRVMQQIAGVPNSHLPIESHNRWMAFLEPGDAQQVAAVIGSPAASHVMHVVDVANAFVSSRPNEVKGRLKAITISQKTKLPQLWTVNSVEKWLLAALTVVMDASKSISLQPAQVFRLLARSLQWLHANHKALLVTPSKLSQAVVTSAIPLPGSIEVNRQRCCLLFDEKAIRELMEPWIGKLTAANVAAILKPIKYEGTVTAAGIMQEFARGVDSTHLIWRAMTMRDQQTDTIRNVISALDAQKLKLVGTTSYTLTKDIGWDLAFAGCAAQATRVASSSSSLSTAAEIKEVKMKVAPVAKQAKESKESKGGGRKRKASSEAKETKETKKPVKRVKVAKSLLAPPLVWDTPLNGWNEPSLAGAREQLDEVAIVRLLLDHLLARFMFRLFSRFGNTSDWNEQLFDAAAVSESASSVISESMVATSVLLQIDARLDKALMAKNQDPRMYKVAF